MIPRSFVLAWRQVAPWPDDAMVEQDLVLSRALVEIFSVPELAESLAFRGGTALHKLHLRPAARYSEDIDLVQIKPEPIGATLDRLKSVLDPWLGEPRRKLKEGRVNLVYRFDSETAQAVPLRLKIEINSREHFTVLGHTDESFRVASDWFRGDAAIKSFELEELLGTKLRALYQRKKGRDLFDLDSALLRGADPDRIIACFRHYMQAGGHSVTRAQFEQNLRAKRDDPLFRADISALLRSGAEWHFDAALDRVLDVLVARLSGDPWRGEG